MPKSRPQQRHVPAVVRDRPTRRWLPPLLIVLAGAAVYANALGGPFLLDDHRSIVENDSIRQNRSIAAAVRAINAGGSHVLGSAVAQLRGRRQRGAGKAEAGGENSVNGGAGHLHVDADDVRAILVHATNISGANLLPPERCVSSRPTS